MASAIEHPSTPPHRMWLVVKRAAKIVIGVGAVIAAFVVIAGAVSWPASFATKEDLLAATATLETTRQAADKRIEVDVKEREQATKAILEEWKKENREEHRELRRAMDAIAPAVISAMKSR